MQILLLTAFIALAVDTRGHDEAPSPPECGYNCSKGEDDANVDQYLSCSLMHESAHSSGDVKCEDDSVCHTGFNMSVHGQLCIDVNECEVNNQTCGVGRVECINTIGSHLCIGFPGVDSRELGDITLINGNSLNEGLLAMFYNGEWILPCSNNWTDLDVAIICRQLDFQPGEFHPQSSRPVYANKMFKCSGSETKLDECYTEFSGVCHHVNLSCSNPRPLPPIEVCLPVDENINTFSAALAEGVSKDCSCIYTANEIRFKSATVSCPDGQSVLKYEIGNYNILPDGAVSEHIQKLSSMFGILNQCPDELRADCSTTEVSLTAILVPILVIISLLLAAGVIIIAVFVIRKRKVQKTFQPQDKIKTLSNPTYHTTVLPHQDLTVDSTEPERIVINTLYTSPVPRPTNETLLYPHQYEEPQTSPTANSQGEYAEIDDHSQVQNSQNPQPYEVPAPPSDDVPESTEAYAVLSQQKAQYATLEPPMMDPQGTEPDKDGYSHLQH